MEQVAHVVDEHTAAHYSPLMEAKGGCALCPESGTARCSLHQNGSTAAGHLERQRTCLGFYEAKFQSAWHPYRQSLHAKDSTQLLAESFQAPEDAHGECPTRGDAQYRGEEGPWIRQLRQAEVCCQGRKG